MNSTLPHEYTFGIEEEFFLVNARSRNVVTHTPARLIARCRQRFGAQVTQEMLQSQIESTTAICRTADEAHAELCGLRRGLAELCADHGVALCASGTHPLAEWREQVHTDKPRYDTLIDDFQIIGRRNLFCGLHIHVQSPAGVDRVQVMNRLMPWLPVFLALSTSSPFWNRQRTGLMSYRQAAYDEWPRTGIPDFFADEAEYAAFADALVRAGAMKDSSFLWWAIRPSLEFPTLELRIADSCTRLEDAVTLASLFRCLVRATVRDPAIGSRRSAATRRVIDENRWRAKRYSFDEGFVDEDSCRTVGFEATLAVLLALVANDAVALGCANLADDVRGIVARGTSAHAQLRIYDQHRHAGASRKVALQHVVDWLLSTTIPAARQASDVVGAAVAATPSLAATTAGRG